MTDGQYNIRRSLTSLAIACLALGACGSDDGRDVDASEMDAGDQDTLGPPASAYLTPPENLADWNLFADEASQTPAPRTVPYEVIAPLFSDYAAKHRFIYVPEGKAIAYSEQDMWSLPEGSVLVKTFAYPHDMRDPAAGERLLETRLLVFTAQGVVPHTYVWNAEQTEAIRKIAGTNIDASWIDANGVAAQNMYTVPNTNQCFDCHGKREVANALGIRTRQLDRDHPYDGTQQNQIDHLTALGFLDRAPEPAEQRERLVDPSSDAQPLDLRARSYLDANCSQCHKAEAGNATSSGMYLDWPHTGPDQDPVIWGVCKRPSSAGGATCGRSVDIVPGDPDGSIYMCRMESTESKVQMPPLGRNMVHQEGVALLRNWIASLEGSCK
jgi:uncharacterized repeat protein (TIGR03806 family)